MAQLHTLWPTAIVTDRVVRDPAWHEELVTIAERYASRHMARYDSGFKHAMPYNLLLHERSTALSEYFAILQAAMWNYLRHIAGLGPEEITRPRINLWANIEGRGEWSVPHSHQGNQLVITYYPKVVRAPDEPHPHAGAIVFHNPRAMPPGFWARKEVLFTPFATETGLLIGFPGHVAHSTFPFFQPSSRKWALIANIRFAGILEGENAGEEYTTFEAIAAARGIPVGDIAAKESA